jgi:hypothetical protein
MPVPSDIADLSQTAGNNSPPGSESPTTADDYLRAHASFIAELRDGKGLSAEVDVASAATCDIGGANSQFVRITGTTTITSLGTNYNGPRFLRFADALTLTHNASTLILPGGASIVTAAGDTCVAVPISGGWYVAEYTRATPRTLTSGTVATATGTSVDFTSIPSWVKRITVSLSSVSTNGTDRPLVQLGDSGGVETTGYTVVVTGGSNAASPSVASYTSGFVVDSGNAAAALSGHLVLTLHNSATNTWVASGNFISSSGVASYFFAAGSKSLSATLDRIRLTTTGGTNTFDAGTVNILYE